jgi:hypothetical protein
VVYVFILFAIVIVTERVHSSGGVRAMLDNMFLPWIMVPLILSGAGVHSPSGLRVSRGVHGSAYFTLSLPVSRFRILAVRAATGMIETVGVILIVVPAIWALIPMVRTTASIGDAARFALVLAATMCGFYSVALLISVAFDMLWRVWGAFGFLLAARWVLAHSNFPAAMDSFRAISSGAPLVTHTLPWQAMVLPLGVAAILFRWAVRIAETREY